jgi:hypothetical protein
VVKGTLRSDALEFVDTFTFDVPIGLQLARVLLFATTSNVGGFTAFNVGPGPTFVLVTTIEGINLLELQRRPARRILRQEANRRHELA